MAAELVGGAFLSSFLNVLFDRLSDPAIINMMKGKKVDQKLLQKLETILSVVEAVLNDAEKKQISNPAVKRWLENLQDAVYDADDLLDEIATKAATRKDPPPGNFLSRFLNLQDREMVTRIEEIIARLQDIASHKDILGLEKISVKNMSGRIESTSLVQKSDVFVGRDQEREDIVNLLLDDSNDGKLSVIPIWGMGGIGKTTLVQWDYEFDRDELTLLWMAEGLLQQPRSGSTLEEVGYEYFNDLASRSFFQPSNIAYKNSFVMHDLMHDLATFYGGKFYFRTFELKNVLKHDTKTRHLSYGLRNDSVSKIMDVCDSLKHARTLMQIDLYIDDDFSEGIIDPCHLLEDLKCLRVLSFNKALFREEDLLHDSIGELIHLRYLDLSYTSVVTLPDSLCDLYNLQTLKLRECMRLKELPSNMQNLVKLRHLNIRGTRLKEMPKGMGKLKDLQILTYYIVGKHEENGVGELGELVNLGGSFWIEKLENVVNSREAWKARMVNKKYIRHLCLEWSSGKDSELVDSQMEKDVLAKLEPHKDLKELRIRGYRGTMFPDWVGQSLYHNMTELELIGCGNCWVLPSLGQLPSLERLFISSLEKVKRIGGEFYKDDGTDHHREIPFRSLKTLHIGIMPWWEEWESVECDDDDAPFPQLEELTIWECPQLRGDLPTFLPSLKALGIVGCEQLGCYLPRAPIIRKLRIFGKQEARMRDLPLSTLEQLSISGEQQVEYVFDAMTHTQSTSLTRLEISNCSSAISFPGDSLPPSLGSLYIIDCKNVEFPMQHQQHHSLMRLHINNSCDSLTSFALSAFPNLKYLTIQRPENLTSLEVSHSQSLQNLSISDCSKLENIRLPASLSQLIINKWTSNDSSGTREFVALGCCTSILQENILDQVVVSTIWRAKEPGQERFHETSSSRSVHDSALGVLEIATDLREFSS
ncbi:hypothetical protein AHAS_Ahas12G0213800 [Arachis hypogaea]